MTIRRLRGFSLVIGFLLGAVRTTSAQPAPVAYYLSSSFGSDSNDGPSPETSWKNLDRIFVKAYSATGFRAGDQILLKAGDTWHGQIRFRGSGTAGARLLLSSYGVGPRPIIYGDSSAISWAPVSGFPGVYTAYVGEGSIFAPGGYAGSTRLATCSSLGLNLALATDLNSFLKSMTPGSFGPTFATNRIWLKTADSLAPADIKLFRNAVVSVSSSTYLNIQGLDLRSAQSGIDINGSSQIQVLKNFVSDMLGIGIYLRWNNSHCVIDSNTIARTGNDAIYVLQSNSNGITWNKISYVTDTVLGIQVTGDQAAIGLQESKNNLVEHNSGWYIKTSGIDYYFEQGSTARFNYFYKTGSGGIYPHGTDLVVYGNIFAVSWQTGQPRGEGINAVNTGAGRILVLNNVFYGTHHYSLMASGSGPVLFRNNIVYSANAAGILASLAANASSDYNCFFGAGNPLFKFGSTTYKGLQNYQFGTAEDAHSVFADPLFVKTAPTAAADFRLQAGSPCVDAGMNVVAAGLFTSYYLYWDYLSVPIPQGVQPDIGAYEYTTSALR